MQPVFKQDSLFSNCLEIDDILNAHQAVAFRTAYRITDNASGAVALNLTRPAQQQQNPRHARIALFRTSTCLARPLRPATFCLTNTRSLEEEGKAK